MNTKPERIRERIIIAALEVASQRTREALDPTPFRKSITRASVLELDNLLGKWAHATQPEAAPQPSLKTAQATMCRCGHTRSRHNIHRGCRTCDCAGFSSTAKVFKVEPVEESKHIDNPMGVLPAAEKNISGMEDALRMSLGVVVPSLMTPMTPIPDLPGPTDKDRAALRAHLKDKYGSEHVKSVVPLADPTEVDKWWIRGDGESEQDWANRIEEHNPSEAEEVKLANAKAKDAKRIEFPCAGCGKELADTRPDSNGILRCPGCGHEEAV